MVTCFMMIKARKKNEKRARLNIISENTFIIHNMIHEEYAAAAVVVAVVEWIIENILCAPEIYCMCCVLLCSIA